MFYSPPSIKAARQNIKTLEAADRVAIKKIKSQKYKTILGKQERQLHHYLAEYINPDYLPKSITKEYEFPKYFYYTVNSKANGEIQKRTRIDSKLFKKFMGNRVKREEAKAQGLFNITDTPIKKNIDMMAPTPKPKTKPEKSMRDILGNVGFSDDTPNRPKLYSYDRRYQDTGPEQLRQTEILEILKNNPEIAQELSNFDEDELFDFLYNATAKKKVPSLKILPFEGEELIESMPSHTPTKKNITIQRKAKEPIYYSDDEELLTKKELETMFAAQKYLKGDRIEYYVTERNVKLFRDLLESVGQVPRDYDKLSDMKKNKLAEFLARDFYKKFNIISLSDSPNYKALKSFGTRNNLIYKPKDTTKQEKKFKLESEKKFITAVLRTVKPSLKILPFEGEELIESMPSHTPTKKI
jgi:hypothetical protein